VLDRREFGRFAAAAGLVLAALRDGPRPNVGLYDYVRALDGPIGAGTLYAALARLERLDLIEPTTIGGERRAYRLTGRPAAPAGGDDETLPSRFA
jgi:DNA-binding PadR family transcriptional regulator